MSDLTLYEQLRSVPEDARWEYLECECGFYNPQIREILLGVSSGVDVDVYASHEYDGLQMQQIRIGLENHFPVSLYIDPKYDWTQMQAILNGLQCGFSESDICYADVRFSGAQMGVILQGMKDHMDVTWYADPDFSYIQMLTIYIGMSMELPPEFYARPSLSSNEMMEIQMRMKPGRKLLSVPENVGSLNIDTIKHSKIKL